jgi:DNA polymerase-3 subunit delta
LNYKEFTKSLGHKDLKPVYLFFGEEDYLLDYTLNKAKDTFIDKALETLNYIELDGEDLEFSTIMNACETLPFMAEKKIVIIKDLPLFNLKGKEEKGDPLIDYIENLGDYLLLIFVEKNNDVKKSNALYKKIKKFGEIVEFTKLKGRDLEMWVENSFKKHNKNISKADINYFINYSSYLNKNLDKNLYDLENEVSKISNYLDGNLNVNRDEIELLMTKPLEMNVFNLLNSISQKDGEMGLKLFNEMYLSNEPILIILHMIIRQLRNMLKYKILMEKGYTWGDSLKKMALSEYEYKKISNQSKNFTIKELERALEYALDADRSIKTSTAEDKLIMEILIANLCFKL